MRTCITACVISLAIATLLEAGQGSAPAGDRAHEPRDIMLNGSAAPQRKLDQQQQMMQDIVQVMADIVKMQQMIVEKTGMTGKKELLSELQDLTARVNTLVAGLKGMTMTSEPRPSPGAAGQGGSGGSGSGVTGRAPGDIGAPGIQEQTDAGVSAKVARESANGTLVFRVALDSETVNLDQYRFAEAVVLRAVGREYQARLRSEDGTSHHRSAILEFQNPRSREYQVVIKGVAGVAERVFSFPF